MIDVGFAAGTPDHIRHGVQIGLNKWNDSSCNAGYDDFPYLDINDQAPELTFGYASGLGPLTSSGDTTCARITFLSGGSASVTFFSHTRLAADPNNTYPCPSDEAGLSFMAAHEAGHYYGLGDTSCSGYVMSPLQATIGGGQVTWGYPASGPVHTECEKADEITTTVDEEETECTAGENICSGWGNQSPLVLDLDGNGFHFSGLAEAVAFDIDDDGYKEFIGWTGVGEADAFLALDRNMNGRVDSGRELFGDATPLLEGGRATDGFQALRDFDDNHDDIIDRWDPIFGSLLLWIDGNHNGTSDGWELFGLQELGIHGIELDAVVSARRDRHGNVLRFSGRYWRGLDQRRVPGQVTDVFFAQD